MVVFAGWQLAVYFRTGSVAFGKLDGIQRLTYDLTNEVKPMDEVGSRYYSYLVEGLYGTSGTIERWYTGSGTWVLGQGQTGGQSALPIWDIQIWPNGSGSGQPYLQLTGLKLNKVAESHKPGANLMTETWDYIGTGSLATGTG